jgi:curli biogenesis system outer membrane secretion channel CsgG
MKKTFIALAILSMLSGCAVMQSTGALDKTPEVTGQMTNVKKEFDTIPGPATGKPISVAVYSFQDKTGQRRPQANIASLSTAVTQGAETFLIQALQNVGKGQWFDVVERVGIDNLTKERLIIRQMREANAVCWYYFRRRNCRLRSKYYKRRHRPTYFWYWKTNTMVNRHSDSQFTSSQRKHR